MIKKPADNKDLHFPDLSISLSLSENVLTKTTTMLLSRWSKLSVPVRILPAPIFSLFSWTFFFHCKLMLEMFVHMFLNYSDWDTKIEARAKLESVSATAAVCAFNLSKQPCSKRHSDTKIRQPMVMLYNKTNCKHCFFYLGCTWEKEKIWFLFRHTMFSKTTLVP